MALCSEAIATSLPDPVLHRRRSVRIGIRLRHSAPRSLMNAGVLRRCRRGARLATIHGSATWPDALRPVHRHNEGALELPIGWRSSTIAVALRQKEQRRRQQTRARRLPLPDKGSHDARAGSRTRPDTNAGPTPWTTSVSHLATSRFTVRHVRPPSACGRGWSLQGPSAGARGETKGLGSRCPARLSYLQEFAFIYRGMHPRPARAGPGTAGPGDSYGLRPLRLTEPSPP